MGIGHQRPGDADGQAHRRIHLLDSGWINVLASPNTIAQGSGTQSLLAGARRLPGSAQALGGKVREYRVREKALRRCTHLIEPRQDRFARRRLLLGLQSGGSHLCRTDDLAFGPALGFENFSGNHDRASCAMLRWPDEMILARTLPG